MLQNSFNYPCEFAGSMVNNKTTRDPAPALGPTKEGRLDF